MQYNSNKCYCNNYNYYDEDMAVDGKKYHKIIYIRHKTLFFIVFLVNFGQRL